MDNHYSDKDYDEKEREFKRYVRKLLDAQTYNFLEEHMLFTPHTLRKILTEFCTIIADHLEVESCTINLKMYNPDDYNLLKNCADERKKSLLLQYFPKSEHRSNNKETEIFIKNRTRHMMSHCTFPYWQYPKGASRLVAANRGGPWEFLCAPNIDDQPDKKREIWNKIKEQHNLLGIAHLGSGVSKNIYQENIPAIEDRLSIRRTRELRKLGGADKFIWNNSSWEYVFKNYYGAPIRIHQAGEVLGILKVENKKSSEAYNNIFEATVNILINKPSSPTNDLSELENRILKEIIKSKEKDTITIGELNLSLLSLAYLQVDLQSCESTPEVKFKDFYLIKFPEYAQHEIEGFSEKNNLQYYRSLCPSKCTDRPPIQILTESMDDEKWLWNKIYEGKKNGTDKPSSEKILVKTVKEHLKLAYITIKDFYEELNNSFKNTTDETYNEESIQDQIIAFLLDRLTIDTPKISRGRLDFCFKVNVDNKFIYILIPPTPAQVKSGTIFINDNNKNQYYKDTNRFWMNCGNKGLPNTDVPTEIKENEKEANYNGEFIEIYSDDQQVEYITDLLLDRLAARSQALVYSIPIGEFSREDTHKLSWAAFELGKLIEREISYKANRSKDPMPLTAMEFFRIPISDLSFVDDFRGRRNGLQKIQKNFDHQIEQLIDEMELADAVRFTSRIKEYRSALLRLGERYEGYVRGNIAIWVYLLSELFDPYKDNVLEDLCLTIRIDIKLKEGITNAPITRDDITNEKKRSSFRECVDPDFKQEFDKLCDQYLFIYSLSVFKKRLIDVMDSNDKKWTKDWEKASVFFKKNHHYILGDLKFDSPPFFHESDAMLNDAMSILVNNLQSELFLTNNNIIDNIKNDIFIMPYQIIKYAHGESRKKVHKELEHILFRNYDDFARDSLSLLLQILNQLKFSGNDKLEFKCFYEACFKLRSHLCTSPRDIEDNHNPLKELFGKTEKDEHNAWRQIMDFIDDANSTKFIEYFKEKVPGIDEARFLYLGTKGIYKRIRTLHNILHHQHSASSLDWQLDRFDLFGFRANCLFKNQVFALYEQIWNNGDPFFPPLSKPESRMEWLCLRTNVKDKNYNALQIAALVDPVSTGTGFDAASGYSLKKVRSVLGTLFKKYYSTDADEYKEFSNKRDELRTKFAAWHSIALHLSKHDYIPGNDSEKIKDENNMRFGSFLFESIFGLLVNLLDYWLDKKADDDNFSLEGTSYDYFLNIMQSLGSFLINADEYRKQIEKNFGTATQFSDIKFNCINHSCSCCSKTMDSYSQDLIWRRPASSCKVYDNAISLTQSLTQKLLDSAADTPKHGNHIDHLRECRKYIELEKKFFEELDKNTKFNMPLFYLDWRFHGQPGGCQNQSNFWFDYIQHCDDYPGASYNECNIKRFDHTVTTTLCNPNRNSNDIPLDIRYYLVRTLMNIRNGQKSYFFSKKFGLDARNKENALNRIKNYVLLFANNKVATKTVSNKEIRSDLINIDDVVGWTAYDLYYYIRSLVPVEIQIRTELTDTFAEQYHDPVYKGHPPLAAEIPMRMMKGIGRKLNNIDIRNVIDYESYVYRVFREELEKSKKKIRR